MQEKAEFRATIGAAEAMSIVAAGDAARIIDVRTPLEHASAHIPGSSAIPLDQISNRSAEVKAVKAPLLLCKGGARATKAADTLAACGLSDCQVIEGGIDGYIAAGGQVLRGKAHMSLERQVRIAAGILILVGVLGSLFVHPGLLVIAGVVGAGLVFAGISDWCGMGMLLAKMPWNQP